MHSNCAADRERCRDQHYPTPHQILILTLEESLTKWYHDFAAILQDARLERKLSAAR